MNADGKRERERREKSGRFYSSDKTINFLAADSLRAPCAVSDAERLGSRGVKCEQRVA